MIYLKIQFWPKRSHILHYSIHFLIDNIFKNNLGLKKFETEAVKKYTQ